MALNHIIRVLSICCILEIFFLPMHHPLDELVLSLWFTYPSTRICLLLFTGNKVSARNYSRQHWITSGMLAKQDKLATGLRFYASWRYPVANAACSHGNWLDYLYWQVSEILRNCVLYNYCTSSCQVKTNDTLIYWMECIYKCHKPNLVLLL